MNEQIEYIIDRKLKREKIDGQIYLMASPSREHREIQFNFANAFNDYFKRNKRRCRAIFDHELYIDDDNYLEPDVKILCRENRDDDIPVVIIEVLSKSTRGRDLGVKMKKYASLGIKEYWIVTWEICSIDIYMLSDENRYELYKSYTHYTDKRELKRLDEDELKKVVTEFSPVSFPELIIQLEDVFDIFE